MQADVPWSSLVNHLNTIKVCGELLYHLFDPAGIFCHGSLLQGFPYVSNRVKPIAPACTLHAVSEDLYGLKITLYHGLTHGLCVLVPVLEKTGYEVCDVWVYADDDLSFLF